MAVILDLRTGAPAEKQILYLKEQLERILTEMEDKTGGVQSIETVLNDDNTMSLIITDMTGNRTETEIQNAAGVESIVTQYYLSESSSSQTGGEWVNIQPEWEADHYLWQRNLITWTDGDIAGTTPRLMTAINDACEQALAAVAAAQSVVDRADAGEFDATVLRIDSSKGTVFKKNTVSTVLRVFIYSGVECITDIDALHARFGASAYLQWYWMRLNDNSYGVILANDSKLSRGGFELTLTPSDVDTKATFKCELIL